MSFTFLTAQLLVAAELDVVVVGTQRESAKETLDCVGIAKHLALT
jgi:hypothetical protein